MKRTLLGLGFLFPVLLRCLSAASPENIELVRRGFAAPPHQARPQVWWHWINGNISREGITADLEAMKRVGIGGAHIFDVGLFDSYNKGQSITIPAGPIQYNTPQWRDLVVFAAKEANRLGLELGVHNSCGWSSSGGPWVKPEDAQKYVVWSETRVTGPSKFKGNLPRPRFYRDLALFAFPTPAEHLAATADSKKKPEVLPEWLYGMRDGRDYGFGPLKVPIVRKNTMENLTARMTEDGTLEWDVPPGSWTLLLVGYGNGGGQNRAATESGRGREVDKLSSACFDRFFDGGLAPLIRQLGNLAGKTFNTVVIDSYEPWWSNWTDNLPDEFRKRRGYDLTPYLPSLTAGVVVEDLETTQRFLFDFRRTLAELMAENYSGRMVQRLREHNLSLALEPIGIGNFNFFTYGKPASVVMGEFWYREKQLHWGVKMAASIAHVYGYSVVGAESLTALPAEDAWSAHPYLYKPWVDRAFAKGINRVIFHSYAHQPWGKGVVPGMTMGPFGAFINRNQTWWDLSGDWVTYLTRCQYLLQSGQFVADICAYVGEGDPQTSQDAFESLLMPMPSGYDFDYCGRDMLMELKVQQGRLVLPSGMSYRVLVLPKIDRMSLPIARKIQSLVQQGAMVVGPKPIRSPCLMEMGQGDEQVTAIAKEVWGDCDGKTVTSHAYGKGIVIWGKPLEEVLAGAGLPPDFRTPPSLHVSHRRLQGADVYFVASFETVPTTHTCTFRIQGKQPELWRPDSGVIERAPRWRCVKGGVEVPLHFDPAGSVFVLFQKPSAEMASQVQVQEETGPIIPKPLTIAGPWQVRFPPGWDAPPSATFDRLISWTQHPEFGIKYYSGTATYVKQFQVPPDFTGSARRILLDLGVVRELAQVKLNGKELGVLWKPPFLVDVTSTIRTGDNRLEIGVTNVWVNRLVGDEQFPDDVGWTGRDGYDNGTLKAWPEWFLKGRTRPEPRRKTFTSWGHNRKDTPLIDSGLLGPVSLKAVLVPPIKRGNAQ